MLYLRHVMAGGMSQVSFMVSDVEPAKPIVIIEQRVHGTWDFPIISWSEQMKIPAEKARLYGEAILWAADIFDLMQTRVSEPFIRSPGVPHRFKIDKPDWDKITAGQSVRDKMSFLCE